MKTHTYFKENLVQVVITTFIVTLMACGPVQNTEEPGIYNQDNSDRIDNNSVDNYRVDTNGIDTSIHDNTGIENNRLDTIRVADNNRLSNDRMNTPQQEKDTQFLVSTSETNLKQIKAGKLAQQNGKTEEVRALGKMMEDAHMTSQKNLTALAQRKNIEIPSSINADSQNDYDTLFNQSEDNFDKAYTDMMINLHEDSIAEFEKASTDSSDTDIKNWAIASLPDLRKHLYHSKECQKKSSNMMMYLEKN